MTVGKVSIRRTSFLFLILVICIMTIASAVGIWVLQENHRRAGFRFESEAKLSLRHAAVTVHNQIAFYSGMMKTIAAHPRLQDLIELGPAGDLVSRTRKIASELPGTHGAALARPDGTVIGDRRLQRVGHLCVSDIRNFAASRFVPYPPVHAEVAGRGHFDLFERLRGPDGETAGILFVSFRLDMLNDLLSDILTGAQRYRLLHADGRVVAEASALPLSEKRDDELQLFEAAIPGTDWRLTLEVPLDNPLRFHSVTVLANLAALGVIAVLVLWMTRHLLNLFEQDIERIHTALLAVASGTFEPSAQAPAIAETECLLPDIEALAEQLKTGPSHSGQEDVTDPLTGLYNRRYFELLLSHSYEQSKRQMPAHLVVIDLNDLPRLENTYGLTRAGETTRWVSEHLRAHCRASDTLTHLGNARFGLILHNMAGTLVEGWVRQLAEDYDARVAESDFAPCADRGCSLSLGLTLVDAQLYDNPDQALASAEEAMHRARKLRSVPGHSRVAVAGAAEPPPARAARAESA